MAGPYYGTVGGSSGTLADPRGAAAQMTTMAGFHEVEELPTATRRSSVGTQEVR